MRLSWIRDEHGIITVYATTSDGRICEMADFWIKPMMERFGVDRYTALDWQHKCAELLVHNWNRHFFQAPTPPAA